MGDTARACRICGSTGPHQVIVVLEMMFGTREPFDYFQCGKCETLQIVDALDGAALGRHYPSTYYSYGAHPPAVVRWLVGLQDRVELGGRDNIVSAVVRAILPEYASRAIFGEIARALSRMALDRSARILDVGCGSGALLDRLARAGFDNLHGVDPFIEEDSETLHGVPLRKRTVGDVDGCFDVIMFNHSLEHVPDPVATLKTASDKLLPQGICLVRLPTTSSEAWVQYGPSWVNLDAPRHIVIPSRAAMEFAADGAGLRVTSTFDDSTSLQFVGSEAYRRDIALTDPALSRQMIRIYGLRKLLEWEKQAHRLNMQNRGDWTGFVLQAV